MPKAASTTLQNAFSRRRQLLRAAGVLYPQMGDRRWVHHLSLAFAFNGRRAVPPAADQLAAIEAEFAASGCGALLLSYEGWTYKNGADAAARVLSDFGRRNGFDTMAALVVRHQASFLNSLYAHRVDRFEETAPFPVFLARELAGRRWDNDRRFGPWTDQEAVTLRAIPLVEQPGASIMHRFLADTGLTEWVPPDLADSLASVPSTNVATSPEVVEVCRRVTMRARNRIALRRDKLAALAAVTRACAAQGWAGDRFNGLDEAMAERVEARYAAGNEAFARRHFGASWEAVYGPRRARGRPNALDPAEIPAAKSKAMDAIAEAVAGRYAAGAVRSGLSSLVDDGLAVLRRLRG